jgi:signal transduction histidine kinase
MANFRAKARAVDLLGKGQIADLPTAISELWKNGYDAYADKLGASLYLKGYQDTEYPFFVLKDDGVGMSRKDILEKWIILGTESKARNQKEIKGQDTLEKEIRYPKLGEKGIGRLSVAYLGSPMLMLTKKQNNDLQVLLIDWRTFELHDLYLEDINIPIQSVIGIDTFMTIFEQMKKDCITNIKSQTTTDLFGIPTLVDEKEEQADIKNKILKDICEIKLPSFFIDEFVRPLIGDETSMQHGTTFVIFNPNEQLYLLKDAKKQDNAIGNDKENVAFEIAGALGSFNNVFKFQPQDTPCQVSFMLYDNKGPYDFIKTNNFFRIEDFTNCDHHIKGTVDAYGKFVGEIRVYNKVFEHTFSIKGDIERKTLYGPFEIDLGYVPGRELSQINDEQFKELNQKLMRYGGLYIYRDNFRVLPYGKTDFDFLEFEKRRSLHAGTHFFSHRRMFGYINISKKDNSSLVEKAGREGFTQNKAYREFQADLKSLFKNFADTFFSTNPKIMYKNEIINEKKQQKDRAKEEEERDKVDRKKYFDTLKQYENNLLQLESRYLVLQTKLSQILENVNTTYEEIAKLINEIEECRINLKNLDTPQIVRFKATETILKKQLQYSEKYQIVVTYLKQDNELIAKAQKRLKEHELLKIFDERYILYCGRLTDSFANYEQYLQRIVGNWKTTFVSEKKILLNNFEKQYAQLKPELPDQVTERIIQLELIFDQNRQEIEARFRAFLRHLERLSLDTDEDQLVGHYKQLVEKASQFEEMAQLGISVEIIDHEFNHLYSQAALNFEEIEPYTHTDAKWIKYHKHLRNIFEQLEDKYKFISPLYRTSGRSPIKIKGENISHYLFAFFNLDLESLDITLECTEVFNNQIFDTYEAILKGVLINLLNNAIYWLKRVKERRILLDYNDGKILIMNSGEPIPEYYLDDIFNLFFSKRLGGRGLGLYLARTSLQRIGWNIYATNDPNYNRLSGACFIIQTNSHQF